MTIQTLKQNASNAEAAGARGSSTSCAATGSRTRYSRLIGALFLLGFLSYGVGFGLVTSVVGAPDFLATISAHQTNLVLGAFLMLLNSVVDVGKGVLFFPIVENHGKRTALAYLAAMILEVVLLAVGVLCLLMIAPVGEYAVDASGADVGWATGLGSLLVQSNTTAYLLAMATLALGNMFLWSLSFRIRLIARFLSVWGVIGYAILLVGSIAEIFGIQISLMASIPGGLFEVALGFGLLIRGFEPEAYSKATA